MSVLEKPDEPQVQSRASACSQLAAIYCLPSFHAIWATGVLEGIAIAGLPLLAASRYTRMNKFQRQPLRGVSL